MLFFYGHTIRVTIVMLSSSCDFDRHIGVLSSSCEFVRHIVMRSSFFFGNQFMAPKRRFLKVKVKPSNEPFDDSFSKHFSTVCSPNLILTPLKSASKKSHRTARSTFENTASLESLPTPQRNQLWPEGRRKAREIRSS